MDSILDDVFSSDLSCNTDSTSTDGSYSSADHVSVSCRLTVTVFNFDV